MQAIGWACPQCRGGLETDAHGGWRCAHDGLHFPNVNGIHHFLVGERRDHYRRFVAEYRQVRHAEGRTDLDADFCRALPFRDLSGRHRFEWRIRAGSYRTLLDRVVAPLAAAAETLTVADLGAGNCWLSARLAAAGHRVVAVDILDDEADGLGAHQHYPVSFETALADFDRLPMAAASCDLVIFNGSLHYSTDFLVTLGETLRVLRPTGRLVVLDSPVYHDPDAGRAMVLEREQHFEARYGFASDAIPCRGFLDFAQLDRLAEQLQIRWCMHKPAYGLRWALRPLLAKLRRRREPATFLVLSAGALRPSQGMGVGQ